MAFQVIKVSAASRISWQSVACQWLGGLQLSDTLGVTQKAAVEANLRICLKTEIPSRASLGTGIPRSPQTLGDHIASENKFLQFVRPTFFVLFCFVLVGIGHGDSN
jgi:hypothetical protein